MDSMIEKQKLVEDHVESGNKKAAIEILFDLVLECAKAGDFESAESMRSRIVGIDPMALNELIHSGMIIEEEKNRHIAAYHRKTWAGLYDRLSVEEANALYFGSQKLGYKAGETVFEQGDCKPGLYLIDSGRANIIYFHDGAALFLKTLEAGRFAGEDTFFSLAVSTTSMIAQSNLELRYLDANVLKGWSSVHPELETKLFEFVQAVESTSELLRAREMDRRSMRRISLGGKATALMINANARPAGYSFSVDLCDMSRGGVCFMVRIPKREAAAQLLGNRICFSYFDSRGDHAQNIEQTGTVVGLQFHPFEDCTVNVKFDDLLPEGVLELLESPSPPAPAFDF
ncbi:MAG: Crp/Fnr family transcriptional regulator [Syntrophobacteraceae bacterium]